MTSDGAGASGGYAPPSNARGTPGAGVAFSGFSDGLGAVTSGASFSEALPLDQSNACLSVFSPFFLSTNRMQVPSHGSASGGFASKQLFLSSSVLADSYGNATGGYASGGFRDTHTAAFTPGHDSAPQSNPRHAAARAHAPVELEFGAAATEASIEAQAVRALARPGGARVQPTREELRAFVAAVKGQSMGEREAVRWPRTSLAQLSARRFGGRVCHAHDWPTCCPTCQLDRCTHPHLSPVTCPPRLQPPADAAVQSLLAVVKGTQWEASARALSGIHALLSDPSTSPRARSALHPAAGDLRTAERSPQSTVSRKAAEVLLLLGGTPAASAAPTGAQSGSLVDVGGREGGDGATGGQGKEKPSGGSGSSAGALGDLLGDMGPQRAPAEVAGRAGGRDEGDRSVAAVSDLLGDMGVSEPTATGGLGPVAMGGERGPAGSGADIVGVAQGVGERKGSGGSAGPDMRSIHRAAGPSRVRRSIIAKSCF